MFKNLRKKFRLSSKRSHQLQRGQGLVEYALILVLVAVAVILVLTLFGEEIAATFEGLYLNVTYPQLEELIDHCTTGLGKGAIKTLKDQATSNPSTYISRVEGMVDDGSISKGCGKAMLGHAAD